MEPRANRGSFKLADQPAGAGSSSRAVRQPDLRRGPGEIGPAAPIRVLVVAPSLVAQQLQSALDASASPSFGLSSVLRLRDALALNLEWFDALLLDASAPGCSDPLIVAQLRQRASSMPLVVIAGSQDDSIVEAVAADDCVLRQEISTPVLVRSIMYARTRRQAVLLQESETKYRSLVEQAADGILIINMRGEVIEANLKVCDMLGYTPSEMVGRMATDFLAEDDLNRNPPRLDDLYGGKTMLSERVARCKDGTLLPVEVSTKLLGDNILTIARDITARKRADEEVRRAHEELEGRVEERTAELLMLNNYLQKQIAKRKEVELSLKEHADSLVSLLHQLLTAQEAERRRLSMDIHDGPLQSLAVSLMAVDRAIRRQEHGEYDRVRKELEYLRLALSGTVTEVRAVLADLSLEILSTYGLVVALKSHFERFSDVTGIAVDLHNSLEERLPGEVELLMYRLAQEALANIRKHSDAQTATVSLYIEGDYLYLCVADDGKGFDPEVVLQHSRPGEKLGLRSMRERIRLAGGDLQIISAPGKGSTLLFSCPVNASTVPGAGLPGRRNS